MSEMPVASGMDMMEEQPTAEPFTIPQGAVSTAGDTHMQVDIDPASSTPELFDWKGPTQDFPMDYDIGTKDTPINVGGSGETASGTPATASGGSLPRNMNPTPYGDEN